MGKTRPPSRSPSRDTSPDPLAEDEPFATAVSPVRRPAASPPNPRLSKRPKKKAKPARSPPDQPWRVKYRDEEDYTPGNKRVGTKARDDSSSSEAQSEESEEQDTARTPFKTPKSWPFPSYVNGDRDGRSPIASSSRIRLDNPSVVIPIRRKSPSKSSPLASMRRRRIDSEPVEASVSPPRRARRTVSPLKPALPEPDDVFGEPEPPVPPDPGDVPDGNWPMREPDSVSEMAVVLVDTGVDQAELTVPKSETPKPSVNPSPSEPSSNMVNGEDPEPGASPQPNQSRHDGSPGIRPPTSSDALPHPLLHSEPRETTAQAVSEAREDNPAKSDHLEPMEKPNGHAHPHYEPVDDDSYGDQEDIDYSLIDGTRTAEILAALHSMPDKEPSSDDAPEADSMERNGHADLSASSIEFARGVDSSLARSKSWTDIAVDVHVKSDSANGPDDDVSEGSPRLIGSQQGGGYLQPIAVLEEDVKPTGSIQNESFSAELEIVSERPATVEDTGVLPSHLVEAAVVTQGIIMRSSRSASASPDSGEAPLSSRKPKPKSAPKKAPSKNNPNKAKNGQKAKPKPKVSPALLLEY